MNSIAVKYENPVIPGFFPDPSVIWVDGYYYLATSSFEYFPAVPIFRSRNLVEWEQIGHVLTRSSQVDMTKRNSSEGIYAPTLRYHDGVFYLITTDVYGIGNFYVTATDPAGPWSDPIRIPYGNIDPSLFFDEDGKVYVTVQNGADLESHIITYEIDIATGKALSEPVVVCRGDGGVWTEGPHLYRIHGIYYLLCACGGTGRDHRVLAARSEYPTGPFELLDHPILTHNKLPDHSLQNLGHTDLIEDEAGNWWALFLGVRPVDSRYSVLGRETFLAPVIWTEDGWPMIDNNEGTVQPIMNVEILAGGAGLVSRHGLLSSGAYRERFDGKSLSPRWAALRTFDEERMSLTKRPGTLALTGHSYTLSDAAPTVFVGVRQQHVQMKAETRVAFEPVRDGEEAGLSARLHEKAHYEIGIRREGGADYIIVSLTSNGSTTVAAKQLLDSVSGGIGLAITSDAYTYRFAWSADGSTWHELAQALADVLSSEVSGGFTGVCIGLYATGNGTPSTAVAYAEWLDYTPLS
ncbi:glycoside hydrolase family 43 protein [Paenibacillus xylaniclasticus]|uniref:glycoside hydrolase family 43 protein n=1 Tax=Paenibacillus xylaniclasticus TaxID=588083 RepID=UPI000FD7DF23|nr:MULTISPECIES: glycoside hydrolase family 43 protein [Paenibacillus]BDA87314.1 beta xylosidase [Paenibacillus xylaniclasticus]GFN30038.1 glycoside hydrolase 43 family protein [Paenibacillus curdlanolyticus]